jgi:hypothetical protein
MPRSITSAIDPSSIHRRFKGIARRKGGLVLISL